MKTPIHEGPTVEEPTVLEGSPKSRDTGLDIRKIFIRSLAVLGLTPSWSEGATQGVTPGEARQNSMIALKMEFALLTGKVDFSESSPTDLLLLEWIAVCDSMTPDTIDPTKGVAIFSDIKSRLKNGDSSSLVTLVTFLGTKNYPIAKGDVQAVVEANAKPKSVGDGNGEEADDGNEGGVKGDIKIDQNTPPEVDSIVKELSKPDEFRNEGLLTFKDGKIQIGHRFGKYTFFKKKVKLDQSQKGKSFIASWNSPGSLTVKLTAFDRKGDPIAGSGITLENGSIIDIPVETDSIFLDIVSFGGEVNSAVNGVIAGSIEKIGFTEHLNTVVLNSPR